MNNVIGLQEYREGRNLVTHTPDEADVWASGSCARWVVLSNGDIRCANCDSRSANLAIVCRQHS